MTTSARPGSAQGGIRLRAALYRGTALLALAACAVPSALLVACRSKSSSVSAAASASPSASPSALSSATGASPHIYGLAPNEPIAAECKAYAQAVLRCVADPHFRQDAKSAQLSALAQMMDRMNLNAIAEPERAAASANATVECGDALSTLQVSSKTACPTAF